MNESELERNGVNWSETEWRLMPENAHRWFA